MKKMHISLMKRLGRYASWHTTKHHTHIHASIVILIAIGLGIFFGISHNRAYAASMDGKGHNPFYALDFGKRLKGKRHVGGKDAIFALGKDVKQVATYYGKSVKEFTDLFKNSPSARLDRNALLFYADQLPDQIDGHTHNASLGDGTISNNPLISDIPDEYTFLLHSRPSATATIYLDFNGEVVTTPYWNSGNPINALPLSLVAGDAEVGFTPQELAIIKEVWLKVSEDYAPFDINITTQKPQTIPDATHYQEIIITQSSQRYGSAGGVAYLGSFRWGLQVPGRVFSTLLGNNAKNIAEAVSHEIGHTLGLYHINQYTYNASGECTFQYEYSPGNGNWAPIMGNSYGKKITQFTNTAWEPSIKSYGCMNQNDFNIITSSNYSNGGDLRWVADDAANTQSEAKPVITTIQDGQATIRQAGIITSNDVDIYSINASQGDIFLQVSPMKNSTHANLDLRVRLYNSNGVLIQESNPPLTDPVTISLLGAQAGIYYIEIAPVGHDVGFANGGYPVQGSIGKYDIAGYFMTQSQLSDVTLPTVSIVDPLAATTVAGQIAISAVASDNIGVQKVDFYVNGVLVGSDNTPPYAYTWNSTSVADGLASLTAYAVDTVNNKSQPSTVQVVVSNNAVSNPPQPTTDSVLPEVSTPVLTPISSALQISAQATDNVGVTKMNIVFNGAIVATSSNGSITYRINTKKLKTGTYNVTVNAYDAAGNIGTVTTTYKR